MTQVGQEPQPPVYQQPIMTQPAMMNQTTVVVTGPQQQIKQPRGWSTGLCGCFEDIPTCLTVMCCPTCFECYLSSKLGETCCLPICLPGGSWLIALRVKIRAENKIMGSICDDCCMVACCQPCVMCQLAREHDYILRNPEM